MSDLQKLEKAIRYARVYSMSEDKLHDVLEDKLPEMPLIEAWSFCPAKDSPNCKDCLYGIIYNHPRIPNGDFGWTGGIVWINESIALMQSQSRLWRLGQKSR